MTHAFQLSSFSAKTLQTRSNRDAANYGAASEHVYICTEATRLRAAAIAMRQGKWTYLYWAVDKVGRTVDFYLSERRDVSAAKYLFRKAMNSVGPPRMITLDGYAASRRASVAEACPRAIKQIFKQHDRATSLRINQRIRPMLGLKQFDSAAMIISIIELVQKIQKHQLKISTLGGHSAKCRNFGTPRWPPNSNFRNPISTPSNAAVKSKGTVFEALYRRLKPRLGHGKARWR
jgi:transposase-like protein